MNLEKEIEKQESRIDETIRILGSMPEDHPDYTNYQEILQFQAKQYKKLSGEYYVTKNFEY